MPRLTGENKQTKTVSEIKWWTLKASQASTHPGQDPKNEGFSFTGSSIREQGTPIKSLFQQTNIHLDCLKDCRERSSIKILPMDGAHYCRPIGIDRRQHGLAREEGQIVKHGNMRKRVVNFRKLKYV